MAPHSKMDKSDVKLLVADEHSFGNAKVEARTELMRFACKNPNTVHFINREDNFASTLTKLGQVCRRNVTRLYYTDSDNDEVPIDGELEFSEALKIIGHRTEKGIFTEMRIDTGNPIKVMKKKVKKSKSKALSKVTEAPSFSNKGSKNEPSDKNSSDMEQPPAWFENYMVKFKADLVADFTRTTENVVKPLFSTTWDLIKICGINGSTFKSDEVKESASSGVSKMLTEADHNYSIASSSKKADDLKVLAGKAKMCGTVLVDCQKESNNTPFCHIRSETTYEDDNLSIYSGEISVTDSESDFEGDSDDFVNIPLPACFNVIDQQKGSLGKELKPTKTEQEPKPDDAAASGALTSNLVKSQKKIYEKLLQLRKSHSEQYVTKSKSSLCNQDVGEVDVHSTDDSTVQDSSGLNVSNKLVHGKEEDCAEVDAEKIQDTNVTHIAPQLSEALKSTPAAVPTVAPNENRAKDELWVPESPQPTCVLKKAPTAPQYAHPYMLQPGMFANSPQVPPFFSNGLPQNMFHQRRMYVVPPTQPNQKRLVQLMPSGGLPTYSSVSQPPPHPTMQPPNVQQVAVNASQQFASHLLEAQAAVHAQHQQVVQAARRAQVQALAKVQQQTSALQVPHQKSPPVATSQTMPLNLKVNSAQGKDLSAKPTNPSTPYKHGVCTPQPAQQGALEMLSEVEQVDQELRKWVQVCQQLIEHILERPDETSPTMPESLKTLAATAITTHEDLERVYQRFRKEVETVSSQVDARKHQRQQQQTLEQALTDEPISILPEKLLEIISSTLSATFSILGNISKLGVVNASSSVPLEQSIRGPVAMEKTQPQVVAAISPPKSGLAYPLPLGYCHQLAPFDVPNYTITDAFENRDGSINSRMPPMASAPTPSSNVMITARQNSYLNPQAMVPRRQETTSTKYVVREFPPQLQTTLPVHPQIQMQPLQSQQQKQPQTQCPTKAFELLQMHHIQQQRAVQQALQGVHAVQSQIPPQMQPPFTTLRESGRHDLIFPPHCFDF